MRWQNKIKSKRYRRAKKKEKEKQMERDLETLAVTDPQALLDKMEETEVKRIKVSCDFPFLSHCHHSLMYMF